MHKADVKVSCTKVGKRIKTSFSGFLPKTLNSIWPYRRSRKTQGLSQLLFEDGYHCSEGELHPTTSLRSRTGLGGGVGMPAPGMGSMTHLSLTGRGAVQKVPAMVVLSFFQTLLGTWNLSFTWFSWHWGVGWAMTPLPSSCCLGLKGKGRGMSHPRLCISLPLCSKGRALLANLVDSCTEKLAPWRWRHSISCNPHWPLCP